MPRIRDYITLDNGGQPFLVRIEDNTVCIYNYENAKFVKKIKLNKENGDKVFIAKGYHYNLDNYHREDDGNSILVRKGRTYTFIGHEIYKFKPLDKIIEYYSPIGNSAVPYPVAIGTKYVYFMVDHTYVPIEYFDFVSEEEMVDSYTPYYRGLERYAVKMKDFKMIHKRLW